MQNAKEESGTQEVVNFDRVDYSHPNGTIAIRNISFQLRSSELLAILGSNGAGKTTLVRHINGLLKPSHGSVKVFGKETKLTTSASLSRRVGIVFQNPNNQLFEQTVRREIQFGLKNFGFPENEIESRVNWALNYFALSEYAERPPMELSGGEKKRLCVALVLAWDPDILILDEPTVGQDAEQKAKLFETIKFLLSQNKTVIVVTHDIEFVWPLQPRIMLMSEGVILADGSCQQVLSDYGLLRKGRVLPPQLVELWGKMKWTAPFPVDPNQARDYINNFFRESRRCD